MRSRAINAIILLAAIALAVVAVRWADREFERVDLGSETFRPAHRPDWIWVLHRPYRRLQHDGIWACVAATVGIGAILAVDRRTWSRRGLSRPGTVVILVTLLVGVATAAHYLLAAPGIYRLNGTCYGLRNALEFAIPGAILGVWAVTWGRKMEWRGLLIGWMWMAQVAMLVAYGVLFG
jgi:hypothetical protein